MSPVLMSVDLACRRAAVRTRLELKGRTASLAGVTSLAPLVGLSANIEGIYGAFGGGSTERYTLLAARARGLAEALVPTALGLAVGLVALVGYRNLTGRLQECEVEMQCAASDLVSALSRRCFTSARPTPAF